MLSNKKKDKTSKNKCDINQIPIPQKEMDTELNSKRVIINPNNLMQRKLSQLSFDPFLRKPTFENPTIQQVGNSLHGHLSLLLHALVVVRRDKHSATGLSGIKQLALLHQPEEPVPVLKIVGVQELAHLLGIEFEGLGELRRRKADAWVGGERRGHRRLVEMIREDLGSPCDAIHGWRNFRVRVKDRNFCRERKTVNLRACEIKVDDDGEGEKG